MKKIFYFIASAIVALGAVACQNEGLDNIAPEANGDTVSFVATIEDTKTDLLDNATIWDDDDTIVVNWIDGTEDKVSYFKNNTNDRNTFTCTEVGLSAIKEVDEIIASYSNKNDGTIDSEAGTAGAWLYYKGTFADLAEGKKHFEVKNAFLKFTADKGAVVTLTASAEIFSTGTKLTLTATGAEQYVAVLPAATTITYAVDGVEVKTSKENTLEVKKIYDLGKLEQPLAGTGEGTLESPYDVTRALDIIAKGKYTTSDVYTKGIISTIKSIDTGTYGNAEYSISVDGSTNNELIVYRGYSLNGNKFKSSDEILVTDEVVVCGKLTNYNGTYEYTTGSKIVSLNRTKLIMSTISCINENENEDTLTFEWSEVENATGYEITFDTKLVGTITTTSYTATDLNAGTSHTISVKAVGDGVKYKTSDSKTCTAATKTSGDVVAANIEILFKKASMTTKISAYNKTWDYTYEGTTLTIANFNNNNAGWDYIKCGSKNFESVGYITTKSAISETVSKVIVSVTACTATKVNKTYLEVATDSNFTNIIETVNATIKTGDVSYNITTPGSGYYYRLAFDCAQGSSNGLITISGVAYK